MAECKKRCARKQWIKIVEAKWEPTEENYTVDNSNVILSTRATIKTSTGIQFFNGVNIDTGITHTFTIKWSDKSISINDKIIFKGDIYRIQSVENVDELDEELKIKASKRGDEETEANMF